MTIIEQRKNNISWVLIVLGGLIVVNLGWSICNYNKSVNFRHDISRIEKDIREAEVKNAELKTSLIGLTSDENIKKVISETGLVLESNPEYLKSDKLADAR